MTTNTQNDQVQAEKESRDPCLFNCFVAWKPGVRRYGNQESCYRGDGQPKWRNKKQMTAGEMLVAMVNLFLKSKDSAITATVYDSRIPKLHPDRNILKASNGRVVTNRLHCYKAMFPEGYEVPDSLR